MRPVKRSLRPEWPTLALIALAYGGWVAAGLWLYPLAPAIACAVMAVLVALHSSLVHEACHGHPTRSAALNEALMTPNPGLLWPYRRFRKLHLQHHADARLTDPYDDPESWYRAAWWFERRPAALRALLTAANTFAGRVILGPWIGAVGFVLAELRLLGRGDREVARAWALHALGLVPVLAIVEFGFGMPLWLYVLAVVWPAMGLISVRTFAEHRWHEAEDGRTIIVERSPLALLFLNNNLHLVHHRMPRVAWYRLPALYRARADRWREENHGYVYRGYWQLARDWLLRPKEPVPHPVWRRLPEPADVPPAAEQAQEVPCAVRAE